MAGRFSTVSRSIFTQFRFLILSVLFTFSLVCAAEDFPVVVNGKIVAGLSPEPLRGPELEAMKVLEKYLYQATGDVPEMTGKGRRIVLKIEKGKMDIEGFRISFPSKDVMVISGGSPNGLKYGVLEFCEKYLGIRFLFAAPIGTHIPKVRDLTIPCKEFSDAPKYLTRSLYSNYHITRKPYHDYFPLLKSALPYRIQIGHNLYKMFAVEKYGKTHPEFYPVINGKRQIPKRPYLTVHWQPCMTNPGVIAEAIRMICDAFAKDPDLRVWNLGQTDGNGWCECDNCRKFFPDPDVANPFGHKNRSLLYVNFCNKIAEGVAKKYPDAKISMFAYGYTHFAPEGVKLHPSLVPIVTYDRANYLDPERKKKDLEHQKSWQKIATEICWYDYIYSNSFALPRMLCHHIAQRLREGYKMGVRHFNGEYFPLGITGVGHEKIVCDGPFAYVTFKLLWNPFQDENKILDDWYRSAVGDKAAPYLRNYFEDIEKYWTEKVPHTAWFKRCSRLYHVMTWHEYLDALPEGFLERCEKNLLRCRDLAPDGVFKKRAEYFLKGFYSRKDRIDYVHRNARARQLPVKNFRHTVFTDDFNKGIGAWQTFQRRNFPGKIADFTPDGGKNNTGALVHPNRNGADSIIEKYFTVTKKGDFRLTVDYRCEGSEKKVNPYISAEWCDEKSNILDSAYYSDAHGKYSEKWSRIGHQFTCGGKLPARLRIRLNCWNSKTGRVIVDNVVLQSTEKDILKPEKKNSK